MTYYVCAYRADNTPILGNLDGQAALLNVRMPERCVDWKSLYHPDCPRYQRVHHWQLETADGRVLRRRDNPHYDANAKL